MVTTAQPVLTHWMRFASPLSLFSVSRSFCPPTPDMTCNRKDVEFPTKVKYFESAEDVRGEKEKGILRLRVGQMVAVYKTENPDWWLGKVR